MSVHAGTILTLAGNSVIDRLQSAGLGDVRVPFETIREVGNELVVDKVIQEPDFTFTLSSLDVSTEIMALLTGKVAGGGASGGSAQGAGFADADGTEYKWEDTTRFLNIVSPWKDPATGASGIVAAAHIVPGYYPRRYRFTAGVTDNATEEVEIGGGSYYYGKFAADEDYFTGNGSNTDFASTAPVVQYRRGGATGTSFRNVFGVIVDGVLQVEEADYTVSGGAAAPGSTATVHFLTAPANGARVQFCYFTSAASAFPQAVHASTVVKPAAVRGRHIRLKLGSGGVVLSAVQALELEATVDGEVEREFGSEDPVGFTVNGRDCTGSFTVRSRDVAHFFAMLKQISGVNTDAEVVGWLNDHPQDLVAEILNPKDPAQVLKTYLVHAKCQVPGTPARVNTPTDFQVGYEAVDGTFSMFKGARP